MHPRIAEVFSYLDEQYAELRVTVDKFPQDRIAETPETGGWSAIQVIEHLVLLERRLAKLFAMLIAQARESGIREENDATPILPSIDTARIMNRARRIEAPDVVVPKTTRDLAAAMAALDQAREELKAAVLQGDGFALGEITYSHPSFGTLDLYHWLAFVGAHMGRHRAQIQEIGETLAANGKYATPG